MGDRLPCAVDRPRPCGCPADYHLADCPHLTDARGWGADPDLDDYPEEIS